MAKELAVEIEPNPVIEALEKAGAPAVAVRGFVGTGGDGVVRLYEDLDTSSYLEIPKDAILFLDADPGGEAGAARAFVRAASDVLRVQRSWLRAEALRPDRELPPVRRRPTFWTCAGACEGQFVEQAIRILLDEAAALTETNPQRRDLLLAQIGQRKHAAKQALLFCLQSCADSYGTPRFMAVPDPAAAGGFRVEPFSLPGYHAILVARHLERPD